MIRYTKDNDKIATITLDMAGRPTNVLNHEIVDAFVPVIELLKKEKAQNRLKGVVITSAKKTFLEGGDWEYLIQMQDPREIFDYAQKLKSFFRDIERPGVPVVAVINGAALGTGFELALACHRRFVLDQPEIKVGLPEVNFGLMPGNGGVIRLLWLLGIERAFEILTSGKKWSPRAALQAGLADELGKDETELFQKAKNWLLNTRQSCRPWDLASNSIPGGTAKDLKTARSITRLAAKVARHNPFYIDENPEEITAPQAILNTLVEGSLVDFDTACRIESRYYTALLRSVASRNMIHALWFDENEIANGLNRPKGFGKFRPRRAGIVGAGIMGSGIAAACLAEGIEVTLKDVSRIIAEQGRERTAQMLEAYDLEPEERKKALYLIKTTENSSDFTNCDLVIESVFENLQVKKKVVSQTEEYLDEFAILASNTISIPITQLAEKSIRPEQFVGLHFFRPVEKVNLVEIVRGKKTNEETIAKAIDFVRAIGKVPIVVKDDWGFFVARVQNTYILEGITMLMDGYPPAMIEHLGLQSGMPAGALAMADDLSFELLLRYEQQAATHYGSKYIQHPAAAVLKKMTAELNRHGLCKKAGFYNYDAEEVRLWEGLQEHFPTQKAEFPKKEIMERFLFAQVIEAIWCLQEGVIANVQEANLGSIYGWGFPSFTGGVIQMIQTMGKEKFIERCSALEKNHGPRFRVSSWLAKNL